MSNVNTRMSGSGIVEDADAKNFRQNYWQSSNGNCVYDFNIYKLTQMIHKVEQEWPMHPDLDALCMILDMYRIGDIDIAWEEGYPIPDVDLEMYYAESEIMEDD